MYVMSIPGGPVWQTKQKISPNLQTVAPRPAATRNLFNFNPIMPFFLPSFLSSFLSPDPRCQPGVGQEPQKPPLGPEWAAAASFFFFPLLTFYLVVFNWLAVWRRNSEGWSWEESDVPRCWKTVVGGLWWKNNDASYILLHIIWKMAMNSSLI